ncbi:hypothetical protein TNCV_3721641 [Trichonephila clavipes]|nr:hypothetical protein TNCV_3721641 [Trichonephila clavipes]
MTVRLPSGIQGQNFHVHRTSLIIMVLPPDTNVIIVGQDGSMASSGSRQIRRFKSVRMLKVLDCGWLLTNSSPVSLKTSRVGERCVLNPSRAQTSSRWCGVVVRRRGASSGVVLST